LANPGPAVVTEALAESTPETCVKPPASPPFEIVYTAPPLSPPTPPLLPLTEDQQLMLSLMNAVLDGYGEDYASGDLEAYLVQLLNDGLDTFNAMIESTLGEALPLTIDEDGAMESDAFGCTVSYSADLTIDVASAGISQFTEVLLDYTTYPPTMTMGLSTEMNAATITGDVSAALGEDSCGAGLAITAAIDGSLTISMDLSVSAELTFNEVQCPMIAITEITATNVAVTQSLSIVFPESIEDVLTWAEGELGSVEDAIMEVVEDAVNVIPAWLANPGPAVVTEALAESTPETCVNPPPPPPSPNEPPPPVPPPYPGGKWPLPEVLLAMVLTAVDNKTTLNDDFLTALNSNLDEVNAALNDALADSLPFGAGFGPETVALNVGGCGDIDANLTAKLLVGLSESGFKIDEFHTLQFEYAEPPFSFYVVVESTIDHATLEGMLDVEALECDGASEPPSMAINITATVTYPKFTFTQRITVYYDETNCLKVAFSDISMSGASLVVELSNFEMTASDVTFDFNDVVHLLEPVLNDLTNQKLPEVLETLEEKVNTELHVKTAVLCESQCLTYCGRMDELEQLIGEEHFETYTTIKRNISSAVSDAGNAVADTLADARRVLFGSLPSNSSQSNPAARTGISAVDIAQSVISGAAEVVWTNAKRVALLAFASEHDESMDERCGCYYLLLQDAQDELDELVA